MKIYNDSIENAAGVNSSFLGLYVGSAYTLLNPPTNGLMVQGAVGVGTTAPTQQLHVFGSVRITGGIYDSNNLIGSANSVLSSTGSGLSWVAQTGGGGGGGTIGGSISVNQIAFGNAANSITGISTFVYQNNRVGIGTFLPLSILHTRSGFANSSVFRADGVAGNLFEITDNLTGTLQSVNNISGLPIFQVSDGINAPLAQVRAQVGLASEVFSIVSPVNFPYLSVSGLGSVGIGTSTPSRTMHVQGGLRVVGPIADSFNVSGAANNLLTSFANGTAWSSFVQLGIVTGSGGGSRIAFFSSTNQVIGVTTFVYTGLGSVGIGTANPTQLLQVTGVGRFDQIAIGVNVAPVQGYPLTLFGNLYLRAGDFISWAAGNASIVSGAGAFDLRFRTYNGSTAEFEHMRVLSNGNVGIGTTGGLAKLHVVPANSATVPLILSGFGVQTADYLRIESQVNGTRLLTIDALGELGLNTSTPTQLFHVQGGSRFAGTVFDFNNVPGSAIGIVSQVMYSTGTGVTWAPIKRSLIVPLITAFNPTQVGIDSGIFIVPQDPINGISSMTFNFRRVNVRTETPSTGITTLNIAKSIGSGAFVGTSIIASNIILTGAGVYENFSTSFAAGFSTAASGDKLAINFIGINTFHQNMTVELIAIEA